jgi:hypothetical protein
MTLTLSQDKNRIKQILFECLKTSNLVVFCGLPSQDPHFTKPTLAMILGTVLKLADHYKINPQHLFPNEIH